MIGGLWGAGGGGAGVMGGGRGSNFVHTILVLCLTAMDCAGHPCGDKITMNGIICKLFPSMPHFHHGVVQRLWCTCHGRVTGLTYGSKSEFFPKLFIDHLE